MPLATKNNALIVKDGKVADGCGCCGGWWCCPDILHATVVSLNLIDYETVVAAGGVFPSSEGKSYLTVNASQVNGIPSTAVTLERSSSVCGIYLYTNFVAMNADDKSTWLRRVTVNLLTNTCGIQVILPAKHTLLASSLSAFNCTDVPSSFNGEKLARDYQAGRFYGDIAFNTTTYVHVATVAFNSNLYGPWSSRETSRGASIVSTSVGPPSWSWSMQFHDLDPASCSYIGQQGLSAIQFSSKSVGSALVTATAGCP